jgi:hypothetical protein
MDYNDKSWIELLAYLGIGLVFLAFCGILLAVTNPKIEAKCAARGGQVLSRPGHFNSCIYPAK